MIVMMMMMMTQTVSDAARVVALCGVLITVWAPPAVNPALLM